MKKLIALSLLTLVIISSCKKDTVKTQPTPTPTNTAPQLKFVFKFDNTQIRLDGFGNPSTVPSGHQAQSPVFNTMAAHYIEMTTNDITPVGGGVVLYTTPTVTTAPVTIPGTSQTYTDAINFDLQPLKHEGEVFYSVPLSQVTPGNYKWLRISVAYQNYDIQYTIKQGTTINGFTFPSDYNGSGTIASFIAYQSHINNYTLKTQSVSLPGANKMQGYWGFESPFIYGGTTYTTMPTQGQAPSGATTVVNPLASSSAVPPGSCLVTGQFVTQAGGLQTLNITGHETSDIVITVSMSTNKSFEWQENTGDTNYNPAEGDVVVDMGVRGMMPKLPN